MQQQWEYLGVRLIPNGDSGGIIVLDPQNLKGTPLNSLGRQGWEVVGVFRDNFWVLLKRPVAANTAPAATLADPMSAPPVAPAATAPPQADQAGAAPALAAPQGDVVAPADNPLMPHFGVPDEDRARLLEQRLQGELQRRQSGGPRPGRR